MRFPLISRASHNRDVTALHAAHLAASTGDLAAAYRRGVHHSARDVAARIERVAGGHDEDAKFLGDGPVRKLDAAGHRAVRDALLDVARDVTAAET